MRKIVMIIMVMMHNFLMSASYKILDDQELLTRNGLIYDIVNTTNAIKTKTDTLKIGLSQLDVDPTGTLTLDQAGTYILVDNIIANMTIEGTNVTLDLAGKSLIGTMQINGSVIIVKNGAIVTPPPATTVLAAMAALTIAAQASMIRIKECHINCLSSVQTSTEVEQAIAGRNAIHMSGSIIDMHGCSIGAGTSTSMTTTIDPDAADGGTAILIDGTAKRIRIGECIMIAGDGGNSTAGMAGDGGHGIAIRDTASLIEIKDSTIFQTGSGGIPNGNGGHGIMIEAGVADACVYNCHIRNTGTGDGSGVGGKAILDAVSTVGNYSIIYHNLAHNISNSLKFDLKGSGIEKGIVVSMPPDNTAVNPYANVYFS